MMQHQIEHTNIILTGFMGTGKSTIGKRLAAHLNYTFVDTDDLIQERHGRTIPQIFAELGEETFRQMETDIAVELAGEQGLIISTGGRMMLDPANIRALSRSGRIFCLVATPEEILARVSSDTTGIPRPLLTVPDPSSRVIELLQERAKGYQRFPQIMTTGKAPGNITNELLGLIESAPIRMTMNVNSKPVDYFVGVGLLSAVPKIVRHQGNQDGPIILMTDAEGGGHYGPLCSWAGHVITLPSGAEQSENEAIQSIVQQLRDISLDGAGMLVALGGSNLRKMVESAVAALQTGSPFVFCPTSLTAMLTPEGAAGHGQNLQRAGNTHLSIAHAPVTIIADMATLQTLPPNSLAEGLRQLRSLNPSVDNSVLQQVETGTWAQGLEPFPLALIDLQAMIVQALGAYTRPMN